MHDESFISCDHCQILPGTKEYISDPDVEKKHAIILPDYSTRTQKTSENPNITNQLQAPDTSDKGAVRKGVDNEEDNNSPWDSEEYVSDPDVEKKHIVILPDYTTRTQKTSEKPNISNQLQTPGTSAKRAIRKRVDKEEDSDSPWVLEEYISDPDVEKRPIVILPDYSTRTQKTSENPNIPIPLQTPGTSDKAVVRKHSSGSDSASNSKISECPTNAKDVEYSRHYPCQCWRETRNQGVSTETPLKENEAAETAADTRSGPDTGSKVGVVLQKAIPGKQAEPPVPKEKARKHKKDSSGSDSASNSKISECPTNAKDVEYSRHYPCQCWRETRNQGVSTETPLKENEAAETAADTRSGHDTGSKVAVVLQKAIPGKQAEPPVPKEKARKHKKDSSGSDSASNSKISECPTNAKDVEYSRHYPCQCWRETRNQGVSTETPLKENEAAETAADTRSGPDTGSKVAVVLQKAIPGKQAEPPVPKEKARKHKKDSSGSDSASNSKISECPTNAKDVEYSRHYPCQCWRETRNQGVSTETPLKENEAAETAADTRSGPDTGSKVAVVLQKAIPGKQAEPPVPKEKARKHKKDSSGSDSASNSKISECPTNAKDVEYSRHYPCQCWRETRNQGVSTETPLKENEAAETAADTRSGPDTGSKVAVVLQKAIPGKQAEPPVPKEKARKHKKGIDSVSNSQKSECPTSAKDVVYSRHYCFQSSSETRNREISTQTSLKEHENAMPRTQSEPFIFSPIFYIPIRIGRDASRSDPVSNSPKIEHPTSSKDVGFSRNYPCQSPPKTRNQRVSTEMAKMPLKENEAAEAAADTRSGPDTGSKVGVVLQKAIPRKQSDPPVQNKKDRIQKKGGLLQSSGRGRHFDVQLIHSDNMKSSIREKKPELITPRKCKEKTKHKEPLLENNHQSASNSTNEPRYWRLQLSPIPTHRDKVSKKHLDKQLNQATQRLKYEFGMLQAESLTLEEEKIPPQKKVKEEKLHLHNETETMERKHGHKLTENQVYGKVKELNKIPGEEIPIMSISSKENLATVHHVLTGLKKETLNEDNKDKGEMAADTFDDLTQSLDIDTENCNLPPSGYNTDSICHKSPVESEHSKWTQLKRRFKNLEKIATELMEKISEIKKSKYQLNNQNTECDRKLNGGSLESEKENGEESQSEIHYSSCASSALLEHELLLLKISFQQEADEWSLSKKRLTHEILLLTLRLSKEEDEIQQLRDSLRRKKLILENLQRELEESTKQIKVLEKENHQKEKFNRSIFKQEPMKEQLTETPFEDSQNKNVFTIVVSNGVKVQLRDNSMILYADTEKQDCVAEEKNKKPVDHYIPVKERLHKYENERAERKNTIRKLQEELEDVQREKSMILQLVQSFYQKILEMEPL
ncbi:uncharacterized protein ACOB8E_002013 [Sarcophilus harrisii]